MTDAPAWPKPAHPIAPHRLARLISSLGIPAPVPAGARSLTPSALPPAHLRRSPTPAASAFAAAPAPTSRFLLHVVPPAHLPHDSDAFDLPPPPNASGYHTHFRRGTLVPVHSTLQAQLLAVAKEYALPSTAGLVLYLISSSAPEESDQDEPGPRLSEDIWKHIWSRVVRAERDSDSSSLLMLSRPAIQSTTSLLTDFPRQRLLSTSSAFPFPRAQSPPAELRIDTQSASSSLSDPDAAYTPDTSLPSDGNSRANSFDLPGLKSPQLIPVLAKVEFDIDRRKAGWYEPWCRSRRINHAKRAESRAGQRKGSVDAESACSAEGAKQRPLDLKLVKRMNTASPVPFLRESDPDEDVYVRLSDDSDEDDENSTARIMSVAGKDPLADIFGSDADSWAHLRRESGRRSHSNPRMVDLALTAADLEHLPTLDPDVPPPPSDEQDVHDILRKVSSLPASPPSFTRRSNSIRKKAPPPITIEPLPLTTPAALPTNNSSSNEDASLAYLQPSPNELLVSDEEEEVESEVVRTADSEKRTGGIYDDFELGLDDLDDDDPTDRRRSQLIMRSELDKIEQNLAQFSPRPLDVDLLTKQQDQFLASPTPGQKTLSLSPRSNADIFPPTPRLPRHPELDGSDSPTQASWPAIPYSSLTQQQQQQHTDSHTDSAALPPPPQLALNGVSTAAPRAFMNRKSSTESSNNETAMRKREQDELQASYPSSLSSAQSPIIPLSPDPFGRFSSSADSSPDSRQSASYWSPERPPPPPPSSNRFSQRDHSRQSHATTSSRFSADSIKEDDGRSSSGNNNKTSLSAVKSIKKLWRKSNKSSVSSINIPASAPPVPASGSRRPSTETFGAGAAGGLTPPATAPLSFHNNGAGLTPPLNNHHNNNASLDRLHFDGETPYPIPRRSSPIPPQPLSPVQEKEETQNGGGGGGVRKSILKSWKSATGLSSSSSTASASSSHSPHSSISESANRPRRPSVLGLGLSSTTSSTGSLDVPPTPTLPEHFITTTTTKKSRSKSGSTESAASAIAVTGGGGAGSRRPSTSSRTSEESRPSFDVSQFEIVSPKMTNSTLSYPYHALDNSMDSSGR